MVCDIFRPLGLSLIFGSIISIALTPVWLLLVWALTQVEEEALACENGGAYRDFQERVPRLFPACAPPTGLSGGGPQYARNCCTAGPQDPAQEDQAAGGGVRRLLRRPTMPSC
jgi:hypothetical protein